MLKSVEIIAIICEFLDNFFKLQILQNIHCKEYVNIENYEFCLKNKYKTTTI